MAPQVTNVELLGFAARTINKSFCGDPLALSAFLNAIDLVKTMTDATQLDILKISF